MASHTPPAGPEYASGGSVPVPDPTERTNQALLREMASLREILLSRIDGQGAVFDARIAGMDKAITLLQTITDRQPADVDKKIANLQKLHEEKFSSIHTQFIERDVRVEQTAKDTKTAVDAALAAQEKSAGKQADSFSLSIGKSEAATTKQIDALGALIQQSTKASDEKFADVKDRITRIEGSGKGRTDIWVFIVGGATVLLALFALFKGHV